MSIETDLWGDPSLPREERRGRPVFTEIAKLMRNQAVARTRHALSDALDLDKCRSLESRLHICRKRSAAGPLAILTEMNRDRDGR